MKTYPYYDHYLKQGSKCFICSKEISTVDYCVINIIQGIRVIHESCLKDVKIEGCMAQLEILYKAK